MGGDCIVTCPHRVFLLIRCYGSPLTGRTAARTHIFCPFLLYHPPNACGDSSQWIAAAGCYLFDWLTGRGGLGGEILHFRCRKTVLSYVQYSIVTGCTFTLRTSRNVQHSAVDDALQLTGVCGRFKGILKLMFLLVCKNFILLQKDTEMLRYCKVCTVDTI
jgi:hypothetical protein